MAVHRGLGPGFLERAYHKALAIELKRQGIPRSQVAFDLAYHGDSLATRYRADFVCFEEVLVELKAQPGVGRTERCQAENYLRCAGLQVGLLLNFGRPSLQFIRIVNPANR